METEEEMKAMVQLFTPDGGKFLVEQKVAEQSELLKNMIEDGFGGSPIPVPNVTAKVLEMVLDYCKKRANGEHLGGQWSVRRLKRDTDMLFDLLMAANYLAVKPLLELGFDTAAKLIRGKTTEEIRKTFNLTYDFREDDEEAEKEKEKVCDENP